MLSKDGLLKKFGDRVKEERGNVSQEELAVRAGVHRNYIGRLERGEACPSIYVVYKIALALKIRVSTLMELVG